MLNLDLDKFVARASKVGAERATIELVTNLFQMTHKAMTAFSKQPPRKEKKP